MTQAESSKFRNVHIPYFPDTYIPGRISGYLFCRAQFQDTYFAERNFRILILQSAISGYLFCKAQFQDTYFPERNHQNKFRMLISQSTISGYLFSRAQFQDAYNLERNFRILIFQSAISGYLFCRAQFQDTDLLYPHGTICYTICDGGGVLSWMERCRDRPMHHTYVFLLILSSSVQI